MGDIELKSVQLTSATHCAVLFHLQDSALGDRVVVVVEVVEVVVGVLVVEVVVVELVEVVAVVGTVCKSIYLLYLKHYLSK